MAAALAGALDWMPWELGTVLVILMYFVMAAGAIYLTIYFMDLELGGLSDFVKSSARRYVDWRTRRKLRPK